MKMTKLCGEIRLISWKASTPLGPGILMSIRMQSGSTSPTRSIASVPE